MPDISLTPHLLVREIGKPAAEFTKSDLVELVERRGIRMLNFRYVAGDGRLKKLNFTINSREHLDRVLTLGERVDGSSLFPFVAASASDLYVVPRYRTAFLNPFAEEPTLDLMCSFYDVDGNPLASAPEQVLRRAQAYLEETTGARLEALGELEYYLFSEVDSIYPIVEQRGYHEAHPYSKWGSVRRETMMRLAEMGAQIKYGHAEVGNIVSDNQEMVQHEIEFLPVPIEEAADQMVLAKWVLREVAYRHGLQVSYAPKIIVGQAGSGMHFHTRLSRDGRYTFSDGQGLTEDARKVIAGYLQRAASLTAWGNTVPTSYLRLVPHQEAPTSICWGDRNRSVLVRVPSAGGASVTGWSTTPTRSSRGRRWTPRLPRPSRSARPTARRRCTCCWPGSRSRHAPVWSVRTPWRSPSASMSPRTPPGGTTWPSCRRRAPRPPRPCSRTVRSTRRAGSSRPG